MHLDVYEREESSCCKHSLLERKVFNAIIERRVLCKSTDIEQINHTLINIHVHLLIINYA